MANLNLKQCKTFRVPLMFNSYHYSNQPVHNPNNYSRCLIPIFMSNPDLTHLKRGLQSISSVGWLTKSHNHFLNYYNAT